MKKTSLSPHPMSFPLLLSSSPRKRGSINNFISLSEKETKDFAKKLAVNFKGGVIALTGELGSGKTTFVQGFAKGLGITDKIISPTFVLIRQHKIPNSKKMLFHIDLYRIDNFGNLGLEEILNNPENIVLIEWAEKIKDLLPKNTIQITFAELKGNKRKIIIK